MTFLLKMPEPDLTKIKEVSLSLAKNAEKFLPRYFLKKIALGREPRIKVLVGFRGVGKTTALLQCLKENGIYLSFDHPYIIGNSLYELGSLLVKNGYQNLFMDEVHYYPSWKEESKALYDEFPQLNLLLSGSAPLAFEPERRYELIAVDPLSLKEFLYLQGREISSPPEAWQNLDASLKVLAENQDLYEAFQRYLRGGAFPIYFTYQEKTLSSLYYSIRKSLREDAPFFAKISGEEILAMEKLLLSLATSPPGEFSIYNLSQRLGLKKHTGYMLVSLLEKMKVLRLVRPYGRGPKIVRGEPKLLFYHPNLRSAVCEVYGYKAEVGALREELAVFALSHRGWKVHTLKGLKKNPDFFLTRGKEKVILEVGGSAKTAKQLAGFREKTILLEERQLIVSALF